MTLAFVVNSGSSSIKWELIDVESAESRAGGLIERIGEDDSATPDHAAGMRSILETLGNEHPDVIGHRVVHGGSEFSAATLVTEEIIDRIEAISALAPLHNPANILGIRAAREAFPGVPNVAIFDTAFHQSLAPAAYTYAIDAALAADYGIRRYGFHGTSYQYVARQAASLLGRDLSDLKLVIFHLGNGASVAAVNGGVSVDTSMGLTPLAGLVMGTRSGDLDPGLLFHLGREADMSLSDLDTLLNRRSGILGLSGHKDMRDVLAARAAGDAASTLTFEVYIHRLRHYLGAYLVELGGADAVVFTAGVGENASAVRAATLDGLKWLGIELDKFANERSAKGPRVISSHSSAISVLVVPTNEELEIARQATALIG